MSDGPTITLELNEEKAETLQSLLMVGMEHGDRIQQRAYAEFGNDLAAAMIEQIPGLKEAGEKALSDLIEEGAPPEVVEQARQALRLEAGDEAPPITEDEIESVDIDAGLSEILGGESEDGGAPDEED